MILFSDISIWSNFLRHSVCNRVPNACDHRSPFIFVKHINFVDSMEISNRFVNKEGLIIFVRFIAPFRLLQQSAQVFSGLIWINVCDKHISVLNGSSWNTSTKRVLKSFDLKTKQNRCVLDHDKNKSYMSMSKLNAFSLNLFESCKTYKKWQKVFCWHQNCVPSLPHAS